MRYIIIILSIVLIPLFSVAQISSSDLELQRIKDNMQRLEKDLQIMQKEFYRDSGDSGRKLSRREMNTLPSFEVRLGQMEEQMRSLRGRIEETQFGIDRIESRLEKMASDIDFRLSLMEKKTDNAIANTTKKPEENKPLISQLEKTSNDKTVLSPSGQYDEAFAYLRKNEYDKAAIALKAFIEKNQGSDLLSNAYYWLGETFYVRENYEQSAVSFLKGYQKLPKGNKAAESLLKLGLSLDRMNKKKEACTTFDKVISEFPKADKEVVSQVESEKKRLQC